MCTVKAASVTLNARRSDVCVQSKQPQSHEMLGGVMYVYSQSSLSHMKC